MNDKLKIFLDYMKALHITAKYENLDNPRIVLDGRTMSRLETARDFISRHVEVIQYIANEAGYDYKSDSGAIASSEEWDEWSKVLMPLTPEDEWLRDYWLERQAMRYADGLADDFHSTWICNGKGGMKL